MHLSSGISASCVVLHCRYPNSNRSRSNVNGGRPPEGERMKKWNRSRIERAIRNAKRTALGRTMCRLAGDKAGGVMMEYVILALLIAAAVVVAVTMFGKTIVGMFDTNAKAMTGDHSGAKETLEQTRETQEQGADEANEYHDGMHQ